VSPAARTIPVVIGALLTIGGLALGLTIGGGWALAVLGVVIVLSVACEGRYRRGRAPADDHERWQRTGEREIDSETGEPTEVWFDPLTGARSYRPLGSGSR
jgi:hypothetical protein